MLRATLLYLALCLPAVAAEPVRVVMLGDSLTAGYGLPPDQGLVPQLQKRFGEGTVRFENAGVSGDTTQGGRERLDWAIGPETDAVVVALGANDMLRGIDPAITKANLEAIVAELRRRKLPVLLLGMKSASNWGVDYQKQFDAIYPALVGPGVSLYPFMLDGVAGQVKLNQPDGIHPNAAGVAVLVERLSPALTALINAARGAP